MVERNQNETLDNIDEGGQLAIRALLRPSLIAMTICGCNKYETGFCKTRNTKINTYRIFETVYRGIFFLACLAVFVKACTAFTNLPTKTVYFDVIITVWHLQNLSMFLVSLKSNHNKYGGQVKAFEFWDTKIREELAVLGVKIPVKRFRRKQKAVMCLAAIVIILNTTGSILLMVDVFGTDFGAIFTAPFPETTIVQVIASSLLASQTLIWILPFAYIIVITMFLTMIFQELNTSLDNLITDNCFNMKCEFRRIRLLHLNLSKMVSYLDKDVSCYFATIFVFGICLSCFNLYQIVRTPMDTFNLLMTLFWLVSTLLLLGIISVLAAILNSVVGILPW